MTQKGNIAEINIPEDQAGFKIQPAMLHYIRVNSAPDLFAVLKLIAPVSEPTTPEEFTILNNSILHPQETNHIVLKCSELDLSTKN